MMARTRSPGRAAAVLIICTAESGSSQGQPPCAAAGPARPCVQPSGPKLDIPAVQSSSNTARHNDTK